MLALAVDKSFPLGFKIEIFIFKIKSKKAFFNRTLHNEQQSQA
jgi:hypothetical protein